MNVALSELPDFTALPGQRRAAASRQRHHHRAVARLHGARVLRREDARLVARADRRDADSVGRRRLARAAGTCTSRASSASTCIRICRAVAAGPHLGRRARRGRRPDDRHGRSRTRRTSARACSAAARCRRSTSSASSGSSAATSSTARCRSTSSSRRGRCWATPTTGSPVRGLYLCGAGAHPGGGVTGVPGHNAAREILRDAAPPWPLKPRAGAGAPSAARGSRRSASRRSSRGARCSTRSRCWARRCARSSASATRCCSARSPPGLFVSGAASPAGRAAGSTRGTRACALAGGLVRRRARARALLALAQGPVTLVAGWMRRGRRDGADALRSRRSPTLHHHRAAPRYRRAVTALTLFGGFASTVFWPLSQWLLRARCGWRATFARLRGAAPRRLPAAAPRRDSARDARHAMRGRRRPRIVTNAASRPPATRDVQRGSRSRSSGAAFMASALSAHADRAPHRGGLTAADAVLIGALFGPMQVAGRVVEFTAGRRLRRADRRHARASRCSRSRCVLLTQVARPACSRRSPSRSLYGVQQRRDDDRARHGAGASSSAGAAFGALLGRLARPQLDRARRRAASTLALCVRVRSGRGRSRAYLLVALGAASQFARAYRQAIRGRGACARPRPEMATPRGIRRGASWDKAEVSR